MRLQNVEKVVLAILGRTSKFLAKPRARGEKALIAEYLDPKLIVFFDVKKREEALDQLIERLNTEGKLFDKEAFKDAIYKREGVVSTGIGMSVAVPHARLHGFDKFFIAVGIQRGLDGIEWDALDGSNVRLVFMIGGPFEKHTDYLAILSKLTMAIKDESRRKGLFECQNASDVIKLFEGC